MTGCLGCVGRAVVIVAVGLVFLPTILANAAVVAHWLTTAPTP